MDVDLAGIGLSLDSPMSRKLGQQEQNGLVHVAVPRYPLLNVSWSILTIGRIFHTRSVFARGSLLSEKYICCIRSPNLHVHSKHIRCAVEILLLQDHPYLFFDVTVPNVPQGAHLSKSSSRGTPGAVCGDRACVQSAARRT
jgi:hypothetical protein